MESNVIRTQHQHSLSGYVISGQCHECQYIKSKFRILHYNVTIRHTCINFKHKQNGQDSCNYQIKHIPVIIQHVYNCLCHVKSPVCLDRIENQQVVQYVIQVK